MAADATGTLDCRDRLGRFTDPFQSFRNGAPPVEGVTFERTILNDQGLRMLVRAGSSDPMRIAQVQVDAAYWAFTANTAG